MFWLLEKKPSHAPLLNWPPSRSKIFGVIVPSLNSTLSVMRLAAKSPSTSQLRMKPLPSGRRPVAKVRMSCACCELTSKSRPPGWSAPVFLTISSVGYWNSELSRGLRKLTNPVADTKLNARLDESDALVSIGKSEPLGGAWPATWTPWHPLALAQVKPWAAPSTEFGSSKIGLILRAKNAKSCGETAALAP